MRVNRLPPDPDGVPSPEGDPLDPPFGQPRAKRLPTDEECDFEDDDEGARRRLNEEEYPWR